MIPNSRTVTPIAMAEKIAAEKIVLISISNKLSQEKVDVEKRKTNEAAVLFEFDVLPRSG